MIKQLADNLIDEADDTYTSLESEHRNSPLLESALLILANAHMEDEYELANYYYDEYTKKFDNYLSEDYISYLKIKSKYRALKQQYREQNLLDESYKDILLFEKKYPRSSYAYLVKSMKTKILMAKASLQVEISDLYARKDKPKAAKVYEDRAKQNWSNLKVIKPVKVPFYRAIFE
jgi:outer membrane protein assembly factor BamD